MVRSVPLGSRSLTPMGLHSSGPGSTPGPSLSVPEGPDSVHRRRKTLRHTLPGAQVWLALDTVSLPGRVGPCDVRTEGGGPWVRDEDFCNLEGTNPL